MLGAAGLVLLLLLLLLLLLCCWRVYGSVIGGWPQGWLLAPPSFGRRPVLSFPSSFNPPVPFR
ncbi:uncharacterized protein BO88DRAFT_402773 [Aspergillus vadensis CBS 113365]|uniref:Uncharacterized protein n=1 Tax=Aspergillus vadensis (strain CBS 113365 / IMI 142717 / IBT 24658) TaxID=1448311 RepID=A0A319BH33_ASPVC|nr:hypothetical protein BO88DRAFT_402773 [Aspergillus vadensis CBS 113365]PYH71424.1 hypothetical protein BO88DRAFT_402773 [Aspergillus vadensis CBS 113365]